MLCPRMCGSAHSSQIDLIDDCVSILASRLVHVGDRPAWMGSSLAQDEALRRISMRSLFALPCHAAYAMLSLNNFGWCGESSCSTKCVCLGTSVSFLGCAPLIFIDVPRISKPGTRYQNWAVDGQT